MNVLVVGGAGYIGAHMCKRLAARGDAVTVFDDLSTGFAAAVRWGDLARGSLHDAAALDALFEGRRFDAVMHFAGRIAVGESVRDPIGYYHANVGGALALLDAMRRHGVRTLVFSSTAAVYGEPRYTPIDERHPAAPLNPYGHSKLIVEQVLREAGAAGEVDAVALRYFNAAGADPDGEIGEAHDPETHLIPLLLEAVLGRGPPVTLFGDDYPTPDGTCVRDYIHVSDLCEAHLLALDHLRSHRGFHAFNLGNGAGHSVAQVVETVRLVTGAPVPVRKGPRRPGDAPILVASSALAQRELGWQPRTPRLAAIIETAWRWHRGPRFGSPR